MATTAGRQTSAETKVATDSASPSYWILESPSSKSNFEERRAANARYTRAETVWTTINNAATRKDQQRVPSNPQRLGEVTLESNAGMSLLSRLAQLLLQLDLGRPGAALHHP